MEVPEWRGARKRWVATAENKSPVNEIDKVDLSQLCAHHKLFHPFVEHHLRKRVIRNYIAHTNVFNRLAILVQYRRNNGIHSVMAAIFCPVLYNPAFE